jgi:LysR family transcriptional regulator, cyn operon transcriptional activator
MEINHLRYFFEVAKAGSFTAAARQLRISQSALSKSVALLEAAEGIKLLQRSKKGVTLTALGQEVFRMSSAVFSQVAEIKNTCRGTKEICEGHLRFGASDHVTNYLLAAPLLEMRRAHPKVIPSVFAGTPNEIVGSILNNELEFGLFFTKVNVPGISYEVLASLPMAVVCHPKMLPEGKSSLARVRSLVKEAGFIGSIKAQYQNHPAADFIKLMDKHTPTVFESNSQETQKRYCLAGGGVAFLARFMVENEIDRGALVEIPTAKPLSLDLHVARRKSLPLSLSARTFLQQLKLTPAR